MQEFKTVDDILDFAISEEEAASDFYIRLASSVKKDWMKNVFLGFAKEEQGHKAKLLKIKEGKLIPATGQKVLDLKIADYLVDVTPSDDMDYQEALIVAMKKEKAAFKLYNDLAEKVDDPQLKDSLLALAQEEAKHKVRFELEYDETVYSEN